MPDKIFADTNIFVRFYRQDDPKLSPLAEKIIAECVAGKIILVVCSVTILEIIWLLHSLYKIPKFEIVSFVDQILARPGIEIVDKRLSERMITLFKEKSIDAADCYFVAMMETKKITKVFSFDHDLDKIPVIKRLEGINK